MNAKPELKVLTIQMPAELHEALKNEAKRKSIGMAALIRIVCTEYLDKQSQK